MTARKRPTLKNKEKGCNICGRKVAKRFGENAELCGRHNGKQNKQGQ